MTDTLPEESAELEVDEEYLVGLLDVLATPKLTPYQTEGGYGLQTMVWVKVRQSDVLTGLLTDSLDSLDISYKVEQRDGTPSKLLVRDSDSIEKLWNFGRGSYVHIAEKLAYLVHVDEKYRGKPISSKPKRFLRIYEPWAKLHPEWDVQDSKSYTLDFFESEFGIRSVSDVEAVPEPPYPDGLTPEYVAGLFDGQGRIALQVQQSNQYTIGYGMAVTVQIQLSNPHLLVGPHLKKFFDGREMDVAINEESSSLRVELSDVDGIESFVELVGPHVYYNYEICELFYRQLLPAYRDGYHHTKDGLFDMLRAYEEVRRSSRDLKYDTDYFRAEWDV